MIHEIYKVFSVMVKTNMILEVDYIIELYKRNLTIKFIFTYKKPTFEIMVSEVNK